MEGIGPFKKSFNVMLGTPGEGDKDAVPPLSASQTEATETMEEGEPPIAPEVPEP